jgi:chromate reductase, NAD(P)H dehydrogenase (quinone)
MPAEAYGGRPSGRGDGTSSEHWSASRPIDSGAVRVLGLCGSLRAASFNRGLLLGAGEILAEMRATLEVPDLRGVAEFDEDLEARGDPSRVQELKALVAAADVLLFATPEYNYSLPGWFKNVLDWLSRPPSTTALRHKPAGILTASAGERGGARAQLTLRALLVYTDTYVMARPEMFVGRAGGKFDAHGALTDAATRDELRGYLSALLAWARRLS